MRLQAIPVLMMLVAGGCATGSRDEVLDRVASGLERLQIQGLANHEYRTFPSQICACVVLPSNAPPARIVAQALKTNPLVSYGPTKVLRVRKLRIMSAEYERAFPGVDPWFTAVLVDTAVGRRVVLLQHKVLDGVQYWSTGQSIRTGCLTRPLERMLAGRLSWDLALYGPPASLSFVVKPMSHNNPTQLLLYRGECLLGEIALDPSRENFPWSFGSFSSAPEFSTVRPLFEDELRLLRARNYTEHERVWHEIEAPGLKLVQMSTHKAWKVGLIHIEGDQANWRLKHEA